MSAVHETAALLPTPAVELRARLRASAVLKTALADDPQYRHYTESGSGDDFSVPFTPAGVLIRGFDHSDGFLPHVPDEVDSAFQPMLEPLADQGSTPR